MGKLIVDIIAKIRVLCANTSARDVVALPAKVCLAEYQPGCFENMSIDSVYFGDQCQLMATRNSIKFVDQNHNETTLFEYNGWFNLIRM